MAQPESNHNVKLSYEERMIAGIEHIGVFFAVSGFLANVLIYVFYRHRSPFMAAHGRQALLWQGTTLLVKVLSGLVVGGPAVALEFSGMTIGQPWRWLMGTQAAPPALVGLAVLLWVMYFTSLFALSRAWGGKHYQYPLLGRLIAQP